MKTLSATGMANVFAKSMPNRLLCVVALTVCVPAAAAAQSPAESGISRRVPDFRVLVLGHFDAETLTEFNKRLQVYVGLRQAAERNGPLLKLTDNPDDIIKAERELTSRIRSLRGSSDRGQIFVNKLEGQVRQFLSLEVDAVTMTTIMEDGPGEFDVDVNEAYPKDLPLATMPPNLLLQLPELPADLEYRFVGRHLVLRDVRANMIVDEIPYAIVCENCVPPPEDVERRDQPQQPAAR